MKHAISFEAPSSSLSTQVDIDVTHVKMVPGLPPPFLHEINNWTMGRPGNQVRIPGNYHLFSLVHVMLWMRRKVDFMNICAACIEDYKDWWLMVVIRAGNSNQEPCMGSRLLAHWQLKPGALGSRLLTHWQLKPGALGLRLLAHWQLKLQWSVGSYSNICLHVAPTHHPSLVPELSHTKLFRTQSHYLDPSDTDDSGNQTRAPES